jgi:hypothetical protein
MSRLNRREAGVSTTAAPPPPSISPRRRNGIPLLDGANAVGAAHDGTLGDGQACVWPST